MSTTAPIVHAEAECSLTEYHCINSKYFHVARKLQYRAGGTHSWRHEEPNILLAGCPLGYADGTLPQQRFLGPAATADITFAITTMLVDVANHLMLILARSASPLPGR
jgi:hypothetical protein